VRREFGRSAHVNAARPGALRALARAGADQVALELSNATKDGEQQAPLRRRRVRPCGMQRAESGSGLGDRVERVQQVARRSCKAVKARRRAALFSAEAAANLVALAT